MSCKVRLYFYDSNTEKEVLCPQDSHLLINGNNAEGETMQNDTELVFSHSTTLPGNGGYEFEKWGFSLSGVSFTPTNTDTLTQDVTDVSYLEVRCYLKPKTCHISYRFNNPTTQVDATQKVLYGDSKCRLIDAPSYTATVAGKQKIQVFVGWKTTESVEGAASITTQYTTGTTYSKFVKFWKNDQNEVKTYYQVMADITAEENTDWESIEDKVYRLGANGDITYSARGFYTPTALEITMDAVWKSPEDDSLYPQGEIVYEDKDKNVIGREPAFSGVDVKAGDDGDFKGIAFDGWEDGDGKKVKKGSTIKTPSRGEAGWKMRFHVSMAVKRGFWVRYDTRGGKQTIEPEFITLEDGQMTKEYTVKGPLPKKKGFKPGEDISAVCWLSGGSSYLPGDKVKLRVDTTFVADYSQNKEVEVTFTTTGGNGTYTVTPKTKKFKVGIDSYEFPDVKGSDGKTPTIEKWTTGTDKKIVGGPGYEANVVTNPKNHTVTAHLTPMKTVILDPNGGDELWIGGTYYRDPYAYKIAVIPGVKTEELPPVNVKRYGYTDEDYKKVWFTSGSMYANTQYDPNDKKNANTNTIRVYVKWAQRVTFDANGGTPATITNRHGFFSGEKYGVVGLPNETDVTRTGYKFVAWYTKASGGDRISEASIVNTDKTRTLYARWAATTQTVTFDPGGGTVDPTTLNFDTSGKYKDFPIAQLGDENSGFITHTFLGWFTSATGGSEVKDGDAVSQEATRTLYAHYSPRKQLIFHADGGHFTGPEGIEYQEQDYFTVGKTYATGHSFQKDYKFPIPSRDGGWSFKGWFTQRDGGTQVKETYSVENADQLILHAHWDNDKEVATLTYEYNGGVPDVPGKDVWKGDKAGALPLPRKSGEVFNGWHKQGVALAMAKRDSGDVSGPLVTATTIIKESMTLKASWSKKIFLYYAVAPQGN